MDIDITTDGELARVFERGTGSFLPERAVDAGQPPHDLVELGKAATQAAVRLGDGQREQAAGADQLTLLGGVAAFAVASHRRGAELLRHLVQARTQHLGERSRDRDGRGGGGGLGKVVGTTEHGSGHRGTRGAASAMAPSVPVRPCGPKREFRLCLCGPQAAPLNQVQAVFAASALLWMPTSCAIARMAWAQRSMWRRSGCQGPAALPLLCRFAFFV